MKRGGNPVHVLYAGEKAHHLGNVLPRGRPIAVAVPDGDGAGDVGERIFHGLVPTLLVRPKARLLVTLQVVKQGLCGASRRSEGQNILDGIEAEVEVAKVEKGDGRHEGVTVDNPWEEEGENTQLFLEPNEEPRQLQPDDCRRYSLNARKIVHGCHQGSGGDGVVHARASVQHDKQGRGPHAVADKVYLAVPGDPDNRLDHGL